jgi:hypothetical protein
MGGDAASAKSAAPGTGKKNVAVPPHLTDHVVIISGSNKQGLDESGTNQAPARTKSNWNGRNLTTLQWKK